MAPESEGDRELTEKIDVFSFGVVVLELISNWGLSNVYFTVLTVNFLLFVFL
jgi:hypothetical protein